MNHREMTKHIRGRLKAAKIPARCRLFTACGISYVSIDRIAHEAAWTSKQAQEICLIASVNALTAARGSAIDHSDSYWSQVTEWRGNFNFEFHGS